MPAWAFSVKASVRRGCCEDGWVDCMAFSSNLTNGRSGGRRAGDSHGEATAVPAPTGGQSFTVRVPEWALSAAIADEVDGAVPAALPIAAEASARAGRRRPKRRVAESNPALEPQPDAPHAAP